MLHPIDTKLAIIHRHRKLRVRQLNEGRVIGADPDQVFVEHGTDPRRRAVTFDLGIDDAKTISADCILQNLLCLVGKANLLGQTQRRNHVAPPPHVLQRARHVQEAGAADFRIEAAQIGRHRRKE